jgi:hypothetical protein
MKVYVSLGQPNFLLGFFYRTEDISPIDYILIINFFLKYVQPKFDKVKKRTKYNLN